MPEALSMPTMLYSIERCTDTYVDACLRDEAGRLLLLSVYGRDTAIKELQARIHLGAQHPEGLSEMILKPVEEVGHRTPQRVVVGSPKELEKLTGRLPAGLFGNLTHMWLYHPALATPQKGADIAWVVVPRREELQATDVANMFERLWSVVTRLAAIPLLPHWKEPVIHAISRIGMVLQMGQKGNEEVHPTLSAPIGNFIVLKVRIDQERLAQVVTSMVRRRVLTLEETAPAASSPLSPAPARIGMAAQLDDDLALALPEA